VNIIPNDAAHPPESEVWHSDLSCKANPPFAAVLRAELIPPVGGDTLWVDMRAACTALPDELRAQVVDRRAFHSLSHGFRFLEGYGHTDRQRSLSPPPATTPPPSTRDRATGERQRSCT
jgi:taurine dioxygenase